MLFLFDINNNYIIILVNTSSKEVFFGRVGNMKQIITRFAPSPTGKAHIGSYRTAMYAWLFARKNNGKFILRIEDTDTARNDKESELDIYNALEWLGLDYDEKYIQSENLDRHREVLQQLIEHGSAYISKEEAKDGSGIIKEIVRFKNPNKVITFIDLIRGEISTDISDLGDFVIARSLTEPLYHLAVVVDDHDESVSHVIRAEEHIANTPRQIAIHNALGWELPQYAHLPIVLGSDKQKLSKRRGALPVTSYAQKGYLVDAVFNAVAMIGWNPADPGSEQEIFNRNELIERFDLSRVQKSSAVFSEEKLNWFNREYLKKMSKHDQEKALQDFLPTALLRLEKQILKKLLPIILERIQYFGEVTDLVASGEFDFCLSDPVYLKEQLVWKKDTLENAMKHISYVYNVFTNYTGEWNTESVRVFIWDYVEEEGKGNVLWPLRFALSGKEKSPDPFIIADILGKEKVLEKLKHAMSL